MSDGTDRFRETLCARLRDHSRAVDPSPPGPADLALPGTPGVAVAVEQAGVFPRERTVVERARDTAAARGADLLAVCTPTDVFLLHPGAGGPDSYYVDLRDRPLADAASTVLDAVDAVRDRGRLPVQPARDRVLGLLRSYHDAAWPTYRALAAGAHGRDARFTRAFEAWAADHADRDRDGQFDLAARRYAHLLASGVLHADPDGGDREAVVLDALDHPAFESSDDLFAAFPRTAATDRLLADLAAAVAAAPVERAGDDLAGALYEEQLPEDARRRLGQYYTPRTVAAVACEWAVRPADGRLPRVLDPASGSGTFGLAALDALASLDGAPDRPRLDRLAAVDVDRFPLSLTALNLAARGGEGRPELHHGSFFDLSPDDLGRFDAVVGNPPYIRQEEIDDRDRLRSHLAAFGPPGDTPYRDGPRQLSRRSDAYVYFVTHATQFLRDGGRLAVLLPTKWLTTRYGEPFRSFLADFYRVEAVVGFAARAFEDALVDTALLLAERCEDEAARATATSFVRVEDAMAPDAVLDAIDVGDADADRVAVRSGPASRTVAVDRAELADGGKLAPYLRAPAEFVRLLDHPGFTDLGDLGDVHRGVTTGANDFFFLDDAARDRWDIPDRFLAPAVKSLRDVEGRVLRAPDADRYLLDVHDYVARVAREAPADPDADLETRVGDALASDGHRELLRYVEWGESEGYHERRTCASRPVWFDLGSLDPPAVLHPKFVDERASVVWNPDGLVPGNAVDCVRLAPDVDEAATMGVLGSTVHAAMLECWGRAEGGGALQLMTYEVESLPVPDVRALDATARERIAACHERLVAGDPDARADLDRAVLDALDVDLSARTLRDLREATVRRRVDGVAPDVLVREEDAPR